MIRDTKKLTTRLVLSHQTGFKNWRYLNDSNKLKFDVDPGIRFGYSGEGLQYLRKALERKFGKGLEKLTDFILFKPLGMKDTKHVWDSTVDESRFANWFDEKGEEMNQDYKATIISAADDLLTTTGDYGKFTCYVLAGAGMDTALFSEMVKPQVVTKKTGFMTLGWETFLNLGIKKEYAIIYTGSDVGVQTLVLLLPRSQRGLIIFCNSNNGYKLYD